ncbi:MAG: YraN family protein [Patescibacteria group bacterium]|nr:YraN family protein [Patescibacteria group bacterium]
MPDWLRLKSNRPKTLGQIGEELAQLEYARRGYKVVAANFFNRKGKRLGEVDFIAVNKEQIIFVEVKTRMRQTGRFGTAAESVNLSKQLRLLRAVKIFLLKEPVYRKLKPQIDVCAIIVQGLEDFLAEDRPAKYLIPAGLDKISRNVTIIPNAVEDWN